MESEDSDSSSLPDLFQVFRDPAPKSGISSGDIVWAKFKNLYWPALVRATYPKQKKISIWYCDEPGKTFKLPQKNICAFHDASIIPKIQKDIKEAGCVQEHDGLTSHAARYLRRRSLGFKDDPLKFFDQTYPFFLVEEMLKKNPNADVGNLKIPPLYISHEKKQSIRKTINVHKNMSDDSEVESTDSEGTDMKEDAPATDGLTKLSEKNSSDTDYLNKVNLQLQENHADPYKEEFVNQILQYVLSGEVDDYLQNIKSKQVPSEHHDIFEKSVQCSKRNVGDLTYTGPVEDDEKLRKLIFYLLPLYEKGNKFRKTRRSASKKSKCTVSTNHPVDKKSVGAQYVASVWLPESIIFAISLIKNVSLHEARNIFNEKSDCKTQAVENILASFDTHFSGNDIADETSESTKVKIAESNEKKAQALKYSSNNRKCSVMKKMCLEQFETTKDVRFVPRDFSVNICKLEDIKSIEMGDQKSDEKHDDSKSLAYHKTPKRKARCRNSKK